MADLKTICLKKDMKIAEVDLGPQYMIFIEKQKFEGKNFWPFFGPF